MGNLPKPSTIISDHGECGDSDSESDCASEEDYCSYDDDDGDADDNDGDVDNNNHIAYKGFVESRCETCSHCEATQDRLRVERVRQELNRPSLSSEAIANRAMTLHLQEISVRL